MAITRVGSETFDPQSVAATGHSFSHTVPSGCDLLLVAAGTAAAELVSGTPTWDGNNLTLIRRAGGSASADSACWLYGLITPSAATGTLVWNWQSSANASWILCINYAGNDTTDVASAVSYLSEDVNDDGLQNQSVHASGGSSGNALLFVGSAIGADTTPASNNASFTEIIDSDTGGGEGNNNDHGAYVAELLSGLPSAITVTWAATDENTSQLFEIISAAAGTVITVPTGPWR